MEPQSDVAVETGLVAAVRFVVEAVRVVKEGGAGTVIDFDNVRLTAAAVFTNDFNSWISDPAFGLDPVDQGFALDPDGDGNENGLENFFGTDPSVADAAGLSAISVTTGGSNTFVFRHPENATSADDLSAFYQWSTDLQAYHADGATEGATTVTATVTGTITGGIPDGTPPLP